MTLNSSTKAGAGAPAPSRSAFSKYICDTKYRSWPSLLWVFLLFATGCAVSTDLDAPHAGATAGIVASEIAADEGIGVSYAYLDQSCCSDGDCVCRGGDPTERSMNRSGPFGVGRITRGYRNGPFFGGGTIYYPTNAEAPLSAVVICPGYTALASSMADWGPFLASHGIVTMVIDTNTVLDQVIQRDDALLDALESVKAEHTRLGSPLFGKISETRHGVSGWSMGGGGSWLAAAKTPRLKTSMTFAGHNVTAGGALIAAGTRVPTILFAGALDSAILGGGGQSQGVYGIIPDSTPKLLYEMTFEGHFSWGTPSTNGNALGRYALAFQKVFLEGDERYRPFLTERGPLASDFRTNIR